MKILKDKKVYIPVIIMTAFLLSQILGIVIENFYTSHYDMSLPKVAGGYWLIWGSIRFLLAGIFHIVVIIHFRKYKLLFVFSIMVLVTTLAFNLHIALEQYETVPGWSKLFSSIAYYGGMANIIIAFIIILQETFHRWVANSLLLFSLAVFIDGSYYTGLLRNFLVAIFGPFRGATLILEIYEGAFIFVFLVIAILQSLIVKDIMYFEEYGDINRKRLVL